MPISGRYISHLETQGALFECDIQNGDRTGATPLARSARRPLAPEVAPVLSLQTTLERRASNPRFFLEAI